MKYTLHKLPEGFIITSDETLQIGDLCYGEDINKKGFPINIHEAGSHDLYNKRPKMVAQQNQIDFSALSEEEQKNIGWFDVISLGEDATNLRILKHKTPSQLTRQYYDGYLDGFQKAQELLSDRMFTLEDMQKAYCTGMQFIGEDKGGPTEFSQSLHQKSWEVEIETENDYEEPQGDFIKPKFTHGKIKITKLL
jgi:hypothetical protein